MHVSRSVMVDDDVPGLGTVRVLLQETGGRASITLTCDGSPVTLRAEGPNANAVVELAVTAIRVAVPCA